MIAGRRSFGLAAAVALLMLGAGAGAAENVARPRGVVELFTSQGCTSCPPADEFLAELAQTGDVVALAFHVDYWDYLGWRDTLASPDNSARQHEYAQAFGTRSVYTPQAVINGRAHVNGAEGSAVADGIARMADTGEGLSVDVSLTYTGESVVIETGDAPRPVGEAHVVVVYFHPPTPVAIDAGRNGGRSFTYWNAVAGFHSAGMWHGKAARFELPISEIARKGKGGCAVLIQEVGEGGVPGAILGATMIAGPGQPAPMR